MERLFGDLAYGVRMLVRYPTLSLGAILTLGVGIGLSTTVFCVVNAGLLKGLPFPNADRIVSVYASNSSQGQPRLPMPFTIWPFTRRGRRRSKRSVPTRPGHTTSRSKRAAPNDSRAGS